MGADRHVGPGPVRAAAVAAALLSIAAVAAADPPVSLLAFQGAPAPGTPGGAFAAFSNPDLNDAGQIAFTAQFGYAAPPDDPPIQGVYLHSAGANSLVVIDGSPSPLGGKFWMFEAPRLNETGEVAFHATVAFPGSPNPPQSGLFLVSTPERCPFSLGADRSVCSVLLEGAASPIGGTFQVIAIADVNDRREVAPGVFRREILFTALAGDPPEQTLWIAQVQDGGAVSLFKVVEQDQALPGPDPTTVTDDCPTFRSFGTAFTGAPAGFNNTDVVVLQADTADPPISDAILRARLNRNPVSGTLAGLTCDVVAKTGEEAPIGGTFHLLTSPSVNDPGIIAFNAKVLTGVPAPGIVAGIFVAFGKPGSIFRGKLVHSGDGDEAERHEPFEGDTNVATVTIRPPEGQPFDNSGVFSIDGLTNSGLHAFFGNTLEEPPAPGDPPVELGAGLFLATGNEAAVRGVLKGDASPAGGTFAGFGVASVNTRGEMAFFGAVQIGDTLKSGLFLSADHADRDGDGLLDSWEENGIDWDGDGVTDLHLDQPPFNADPDRKDLYVEIDYMDCAQGGCAAGDNHNHLPNAAALQDVIDAFADAPVNNPTRSEDGAGPSTCSDGVDNGGGDGADVADPDCRGIVLHLSPGSPNRVDEPLPEIEPIRFEDRGAGAADDFQDLKEGNPRNPCGTGPSDGRFGTQAERASANCLNLLAAKRLAFRYAINGHNHTALTSSGIGELPGNDFMVTLGGWTAIEKVRHGGARALEAGTFMHELGHTLALGHGGGDHINHKPNYVSVMNYSFQAPQLFQALPSPNDFVFTDRPLDYSRWALPPTDPARLDESSLDETRGIDNDDPPAGLAARWPNTVYTRYFAAADKCGFKLAGTVGDIDWDGNGGIEADVQAAINNPDTVSNPGGPEACQVAGNMEQELEGFDDWANVRLNFRLFVEFADGRRPVPDGPEMPPDLLAPRDRDGDGIPDASDLCPDEPEDFDGFEDTDGCPEPGPMVDVGVAGFRTAAHVALRRCATLEDATPGVCDPPATIRLKNFGAVPVAATFAVTSDQPGASPSAGCSGTTAVLVPHEVVSIALCRIVYSATGTYTLTLTTNPTVGTDTDPTNNSAVRSVLVRNLVGPGF